MTSHFHIPGSFEPHALTGVHPNVFRPPTSPSSSACLGPSTPHNLPDPPAKRKRDDTRENTPTRDAGGSRYVLADPPCGTGGGGLEDSVHSDIAYRRQLGPSEEDGEGGPGWRSAALGAIGGVVGRVWEFCKAGAFRGFYAGGGTGYAMGEGRMAAGDGAEKMGFGMGISEDALRGFGMGRPEDTGFGTENATGAFEFGRPEAAGPRFRMERPEDSPRFRSRPLDPGPDPAPPRASPAQPSAKRRHISDELGRNWVMVDDPARHPARRRNRNSSPNVTTGRRISTPVARLNTTHKAPTPRRSHRVSHAGSPALSPREPASFAAQRSPTAPDFSPSRIPLSSARPRRSNSALASPASLPRAHRKSTSLTEAPRARPPSSSAPLPGAKTESPRLDPEARKLAARREREERDADVQMAAFNARLQDMIRQGREALGTSFEVEGEGEGEADGWMDE